jgi:hypothetical protein
MPFLTSQYNYKGENRIDITIKGKSNGGVGACFAPTWDLVMDFKNGTITEKQYTEKYYKLMVDRWNTDAQFRENMDYLVEKAKEENIVLVCFCPAYSFCHRYLLINFLLYNRDIQYMGEIINSKNSEKTRGDNMINKFKDEYSWLSNFAHCQVSVNGAVYPSVEHAYQSAKNNDHSWKRYCQTETDPAKVKKESRKVSLVPGWDSYKVQIMKDLINQKFEQQPYKNALINTGDLYIQEGNTWGDTFWGVDLRSDRGKNILGKLIMDKRTELLSRTE